jgi:hypothetical protein
MIAAFDEIDSRGGEVKSIATSDDIHKRLEGVVLGSFPLKGILITDPTLPNGVAVVTPNKEGVPTIEMIEKLPSPNVH